MEQEPEARGQSEIPQYTLSTIIVVWAAAALPMGLLGWVVTPALVRDPTNPGFTRLLLLTIGLIWQFVLVVILLHREVGELRWSTIRARLWLVTPRVPQTGKPSRRLWWWLVPVAMLTALFDLQLRGILNTMWVAVFPWLAESGGGDLGNFLSTPEARAQVVGNWGVFALFVISALFNTVLGEELLFRGLLLPRMAGAFGRWDWVANGLLFGLYHLHQPWGMLSSALKGMLLFALPSRYFRTSLFGIVAHSGQSLFFSFLLLGLILGYAQW